MKTKILKYSDLALFYIGVSLNIWMVCRFIYFGGGDGPSHLYYSKVVQYLLAGNTFLSQYFVLNTLPVPNLTDHYLIALFDVFFRSAVSEKILLIIFVAGFPLIFRATVKRYNPESLAASTFIIPLTHCTLLYFGGYNFCISFTFLFAAMYYYLKNFSDSSKLYSPVKYFLFFILILLNYFTNGISFLFLSAGCGFAELYLLYSQRKLAIKKTHTIKRLLLFAALWVPSFIMLNIFNNDVYQLHHTDLLTVPFNELMRWVFDFKCLFVYDTAEYSYTHILFFWLLLALFATVYCRLLRKRKLEFALTDIFLLLSILTLLAYIIIPQGAGVGMVSDRLLYYFFIFLIFWIALQKIPAIIALMLSVMVMIIHVMFFFNTHYKLLDNLNNDALNVQKASAFVPSNSVIGLYRFDHNPMELSISNIIGADKPEVILEKYEPDYGWFAVNRTMNKDAEWKMYRSPDNKLVWVDAGTKRIISVINYVFVFGDYQIYLKSGKSDLNYLQQAYTKVFSSDDNKVHILQLNK